MDDELQGSPQKVVEEADDGERYRLILRQPHLVLRDPGDELPKYHQERVRDEGDESQGNGEDDASHLQPGLLAPAMTE